MLTVNHWRLMQRILVHRRLVALCLENREEASFSFGIVFEEDDEFGHGLARLQRARRLLLRVG